MDQDTVDKYAEASTEIAKTAGKGIDAVSGVGKFAESIFGDLVVDAVGLVGDRLKFYRLERWHLLAAKTQKRLASAGIVELRSVPPKVAIPLIESATLEEDDHLHSMWAELLATAMEDNDQEIDKKFVSVLSELSIGDALVFQSIFKESNSATSRQQITDGTISYGPSIEGITAYDSISVVTLARLGLIAPAYVEFNTYSPPGHDDRYGDYGPYSDKVRAYGNLEHVEVTDFGVAFGRAVLTNAC